MDGFKRQAVLLALLEAMKDHGSWCGETHIQKSVYFLEEGLGVPLEVEFVLYKHGPYSFDLREVLGEMRGNFLIDLESRRPFGPSLVVTDFGESLKERFPKTLKRYAQQVEFVAKRLSARDVAELERLGTALYVRRHCPDRSAEEQAHELTALKPHVQLSEAQKAVHKVEELLKEACSLAASGVAASSRSR